MARSAGAGVILDLVSRHPALRELPLASTTLLLRAIGAMRELDQPVLRFGARVPDPEALARVLNVDPGEAAALLPGLIECDLLRQDAGGALYSPLLLEMEERRQAQAERRRALEEAAAQAGEGPVSARAMASRVNGANGGRPRTRGPEGQRQMPLVQVVAGSDGNPTGYDGRNPAGSFSETHRVLTSASTLAEAEAQTQTLAEESQGRTEGLARAIASDAETHGNPAAKPQTKTQAGAPVDVVALARELRVITGLAAEPTRLDLSTVRGWLADGHTAARMRDVIRGIAADAKERPAHLGYFKQPMAAAIVVQSRGSASDVDSTGAAPAVEDRRLRPRQPDESDEVYLRRTKGLRPLVPPAREPQEDAESYRRRLKCRFDIEVMTAQSVGAPVPDWEAYAAGAQLAA